MCSAKKEECPLTVFILRWETEARVLWKLFYKEFMCQSWLAHDSHLKDLRRSTADRLGGIAVKPSSIFLSGVTISLLPDSIDYIFSFENVKDSSNSQGGAAETFACALNPMFRYQRYRASCLSLTGRLVFPATMDWSAVSAVGEWAAKGFVCRGCRCLAKTATFSKRKSMRPSTGTPEH